MKLIDKIIGWVALLALIFSLVYYSIQNLWGILNWITLVLGVAGVIYFLFIYYRDREKELSKRSLQYGSNVLVQVIVFIAIVGLLAFITTRRHFRTDWTENKLFSLADQTEKLVSGLEKEVKATAFYRSSEQRGAQDLLDEYTFRSGNFKYEFVDPDEKPQIARQYNINQYNTVILESGVKRETVRSASKGTNTEIRASNPTGTTARNVTNHTGPNGALACKASHLEM